MKRRKIRKYKTGKRNSGMKFSCIIGIIIIAIVAGYLTARYIIGPMLGYDTEVLKIDLPSSITASADPSENNESVDTEKFKYALQYGLFSSKEKANRLKKIIEKKGVSCEVVSFKNQFKVISNKCNKKEEAIDALKKVSVENVKDVFITGL